MTLSDRHAGLPSTEVTAYMLYSLIISAMATSQAPFHRLLSFFAGRAAIPGARALSAARSHATSSSTSGSSPAIRSDTITFLDSLKGDLALGLNFPLALIVSFARHAIFRTGNGRGFQIHIPSVRTSRKLLGSPGSLSFNTEKRYGLLDLLREIGKQRGSLINQLDAFGIWSLAARRVDGKVSGADLVAFQEGTVLESIARRRRGREDTLPLWRGGPLS
jgi:hypothetical protein